MASVPNNKGYFGSYGGQYVPETLMVFIGAADIYLTPYLTEAQITSGTLAYAFGAGNAVVSTPYWHAAELLTAERGKLVPFRDAKAIAVAVVELLRDEALRHSMRKNAYKLGRDMIWSRVAQLYAKSFEQARQDHSFVGRKSSPIKTLDEQPGQLPELKLDHLFRMSDSTGIFQHASFTVPNFAEGYCTDDNARALVLALMLQKLGHGSPQLGAQAATYAAFLNHAFDRQRGRFRNFMSFDRRWLEEVGSEDCQGHALWALGLCVSQAGQGSFQMLAAQLFEQALPVAAEFMSRRAPGRSRSSALTNICAGSAATGARTRFANRSRRNLCNATPTPPPTSGSGLRRWFPMPTPSCRTRMILSGRCLNNEHDAGTRPQDLALADQDPDLGRRRFSARRLERILSARQGARACSTSNPSRPRPRFPPASKRIRPPTTCSGSRKRAARSSGFSAGTIWAWRSTIPATGGCRDGLHVDRLSQNQGAESTLAFLLSLAEMQALQNTLTSFKEPAGK